MRKLALGVACVACLQWGGSAAADGSLTTFCLATPPAGEPLLTYYKNECPTILAAAQAQASATAETANEKAQAELAKAKLEAVKAGLPASAPAAAAGAAPSLDAFKVVALSRETELLLDVGRKVGQGMASGSGTTRLVLLSSDEAASLRSSTLPPEVLLSELDWFVQAASSIARTCKPVKNASLGTPFKSFSALSSGSLLVADSLFGLALKVSQAFQTTLTATVTGGLEANAARSAVLAGAVETLAASAVPTSIGLPRIQKSNAIIEKLVVLRQQSDELIEAMNSTPDKHACRASGTALLNSVKARLDALNAPAAAGAGSQLLTTMRLAELEATQSLGVDPGVSIGLIDVLQSGSGLAATKSGFTSQSYTRLASASAAYRVERLDGSIVAAGVVRSGLDVGRYDKKFVAVAPKPAAPRRAPPSSGNDRVASD